MEYVNEENTVQDIIISRDMNQDIASNDMQNFYAKLGVKDVHQTFNYIKIEDLDRTFRHGSRTIDSIIVSPNIQQCVEGSKLLE